MPLPYPADFYAAANATHSLVDAALGGSLSAAHLAAAIAMLAAACWYLLECLWLYLRAPAVYWSEVTHVGLDVVASQSAAALTLTALHPAARLTPLGHAVARGLAALGPTGASLAHYALLYGCALLLRPVYARLQRQRGTLAMGLAAAGAFVFGVWLAVAFEQATHFATHPAIE